MVEDGANGLLAAPGDADALGAALARFAGDSALRARLTDGARVSGETRTMAATARRVAALLSEALGA